MYNLHTQKVTKTVSSVTFRLHIFKNSVLSFLLLLRCSAKGFKIRSKRLINLLLGHFGRPTIGLSFKSLISEMVISSLFCSMINYANFQVL